MDNQDTDCTAITSKNNDIFDEAVNFIEDKVISADGLTLAEVFQVLVQMLNGDLELVKKVLAHAKIMVKYGMKIAKESQLSKKNVHLALEGKESSVSIKAFANKPSVTPSVKQTIKKKGKGI